jgi:transposase InsO family protein
MVSLAERRSMTDYLIERYKVSERHACKVVALSRSTYRDRPSQVARIELAGEITRLSYQYDRFGYRKIHVLLVNDGWRVSRETVRLIRKREGLQVRKKQHKKRLLGQSTTQLKQAEYPNHVWSYDFVFDQSEDGRTLKHLTIVDEFTKEGLMIEVQRSITSTTVIRCLDFLFDVYGTPACIKSDNGPEFVARQVQTWLKQKHVDVHYIDPGSPWQNGHCESFNGVFRDGCLNKWSFYSIAEARRVIEQWLDEYNTIRPHGAINMMTPRAFAAIHRQSLQQVA